ncbi:4-hydroxy-tetrahydrodipicolinate synthase [Allopusillimonas ginsengisoli]|uniref:4-hydroxy-tetrahydrodipicolinate synthase n=1 Tax=Allopusillimonas ginsengisoli TaxID=453575 RepID=UPI0010C1612C|nr:4-hydroxy-tetrahydrodipicolinate synthase [Allopusillimonas ginsengisoli]
MQTSCTSSSLRGSIPAIVTPMKAGGAVDMTAFFRLLDWHVEQGSDAIVVAGTTGEVSTLSIGEQCRLIADAKRHLAGRLPLIAGTGGNATYEAIELATAAKEIGADAHLSVVPYYNKPSQGGLYQHFRAIAEAVDLPMIIYNVPGRTVADINNDTVIELSAVPGIIGIKDATGDMERGFDLVCRVPENFLVLSGDDGTALALTLLGGDGVISVTANAAPRLMHDMIVAAFESRVDDARKMNSHMVRLHRDLFAEPNPAPLKWIMSRMGLLQNNLRLPLLSLSDANQDLMRQAMTQAQL